MLARSSGLVTFYIKGEALLGYYLGVHWIRNQANSKDQVMRRDEDTIRYSGTLSNISFVNTSTLTSDGIETVYELNLKQNNDFGVNRHWEITPALSMKMLELMQDCKFSYENMQGEVQSGKLRDAISFKGKIKSFTIHNYEGYDIVLHFPGGSKGVERRKEKLPRGIWFFYSAVNNKRLEPKVAGERGTIKFQVKVIKTGTIKLKKKRHSRLKK